MTPEQLTLGAAVLALSGVVVKLALECRRLNQVITREVASCSAEKESLLRERLASEAALRDAHAVALARLAEANHKLVLETTQAIDALLDREADR